MNSYKNIPIVIVLLYSLMTIYLFEFGVINFPHGDKFILYLFLICANAGIGLGYYFGYYSKQKKTTYPGQNNGITFLLNVFQYSFVVYIITFIPSFFIETRTYSLNLSDLFQNIQIGFTDSAILYNNIREANKVSGIWKLINYIIVLTGFIRWTFFPLTIYLWQYINNYHKICMIIFAFFYLISFITTGTTAGAFTIAFIIGIPIIMKKYRKQYIYSRNHIHVIQDVKRKVLSIILIFIVIFSCLWLFSNNMKSREVSLYSGKGDYSAFPWNIMPEDLRPAIYWLTAYVAQGYSALSYCLELPFSSTFGLGNSWFTIQNFSSLLGVPILQYTYLGKAEALGFGAYKNWHTVYTWIANDVSFIGVPIILFILYYLMAQSWCDYLDYNDGFAFIFVTIMGFFSFYISANNTVFSHADTLFAFYIILYLWKRYNKKYNYDFETKVNNMKVLE